MFVFFYLFSISPKFSSKNEVLEQIISQGLGQFAVLISCVTLLLSSVFIVFSFYLWSLLGVVELIEYFRDTSDIILQGRELMISEKSLNSFNIQISSKVLVPPISNSVSEIG